MLTAGTPGCSLSGTLSTISSCQVAQPAFKRHKTGWELHHWVSWFSSLGKLCSCRVGLVAELFTHAGFWSLGSLIVIHVKTSPVVQVQLSLSHTHTHHQQHSQQGPRTHPRVLMKPLTVPSAYRDTMSPIWRKLEAESDILQLVPRLRQRQKAQVHQVETFSCRLGAPSLTQSRKVLTCSRAVSAQTGSSTCPDHPRSPHRSQTETLPGCTSARGLQRYGRAPLPLRAAGCRVRASVRA